MSIPVRLDRFYRGFLIMATECKIHETLMDMRYDVKMYEQTLREDFANPMELRLTIPDRRQHLVHTTVGCRHMGRKVQVDAA